MSILFNKYLEKNIYSPLGLTHTLFNPQQLNITSSQCAATELEGNTRNNTVSFPNIRHNTIRCEVHDENTYYSFNGVSGHAGLFSTLDDMRVMLQLLLNNGKYKNVILWDKQIEDLFSLPNRYDDTFALGFRRSGIHHYAHFGRYSSIDAIGHTGFTGTLTVVDRSKHLAFVLLTNKIHSKYVNGKFIGNNYTTGKYKQISENIYIITK